MNHMRLILEMSGLVFSEGEVQGENPWERERGFFVVAAGKAPAITLGKRFEQYAVVFGRVGEEAQLLEIPLEPKR